MKPGRHVLDVACGPGIPSLMVAPLVAPDGSVVGIDLAPGMVELAKKKAEETGLTNVTFREADAERISLSRVTPSTWSCATTVSYIPPTA